MGRRIETFYVSSFRAKKLDQKKAGSLHYFNPDTHAVEFSNDPLGNLQHWMIIMHDLLHVLCNISSDKDWFISKEKKVLRTPW